MIGAVGDIIGCLLAAAGIGGVTGWLLRQVSISELNHHIYDITTALQIKEQALHAAQLELKAKASTILIYDNKISAAESLAQSQQQELTAQAERIRALRDQWETVTRKMAVMEQEHQGAAQRYEQSDATIAAFEQEARQANAARSAAQQALAEQEAELTDLRARLAEAETNMAKLERLRIQLPDLEPAQGRVHWLEVQLSEKDVQHRAAIHEAEEQKQALERRIAELEPLARQAADFESIRHDLETKYQKLLKQRSTDAALLKTQATAMKKMEKALAERDQALQSRDKTIAALQGRPGLLPGLEPDETGKSETVRAGLRLQADHQTRLASADGPNPDQLALQIKSPSRTPKK